MIEINNVIKNIVGLTDKFYRLGNISMDYLLKETGYFEQFYLINEEGILKEIINHPEYINQWMNWSENKRSSSGWYFKKSIKGNYIVGYFPEKSDLKPKEYSSPEKACAFFIKMEIEEIRENS